MRNRGPLEKKLMQRRSRMILVNLARILDASGGTASRRSGVLAERRRLFAGQRAALCRAPLRWWEIRGLRGLVCLITWRSLGWLAAILLNGTVARAQSYSIDWYKISSGGGTSLGGAYSLNATIGQQEAGGMMSGGNYSLTSGFWSLLSIVPSPGAPTLTIALTSTNSIIISWPSPSTGFTIQQTTSLTDSIWIAPSEGISDDGLNKSIVLQSLAGTRLFRLTR